MNAVKAQFSAMKLAPASVNVTTSKSIVPNLRVGILTLSPASANQMKMMQINVSGKNVLNSILGVKRIACVIKIGVIFSVLRERDLI